MDWIHTANETLLIKKIPGDGNCLFAALIHQVYKDDLSIHEHQRKIALLRQQISSYIKNNIDKYRDTILENSGINNGKAHYVRPEYIIGMFLENLSRNGFWGGEETIAAFAEMEEKCIVIYHEGGNTITYYEEYQNRGTLNLVYRNITGTGDKNHYDSVIEIIRNPTRQNITNHLEVTAQRQRTNTYVIENITPEEISNTITSQQEQDIKIATWNVRGCSNPMKRTQIDEALHQAAIDIACLQETKMRTGMSVTKHYSWYHGGKRNAENTNRGVAILVKEASKARLLGFKDCTESICEGLFELGQTKIRIIVAHMPSDARVYTSFKELAIVIARGQSENTVILGDFNAHIGKTDIERDEHKYVGPQLYHETSNENGRELLNLLQLFKLSLKTSWAKSKSVLTTWSNGKSVSQIDHILLSDDSKKQFTISAIQANFSADVKTDHKIISARLRPKKDTPTPNRFRALTKSRKLSWNIKRLKIKEEKEAYHRKLEEKLKGISLQEHKTTERLNHSITDAIHKAAAETLHRPSSPIPESLEKAREKYKQALWKRNQQPEDEIYRKQLKEAAAEKRTVYRDHEEAKCVKFFENIESYHPALRLHNTYKYLKKHRKSSENGGRTFIPIKHWEEDLISSTGDEAHTIEETSYWPLNPPPTTEEVAEYCRTQKNGKAPGTDNISAELIKEGPEELGKIIGELMALTWTTNKIPKVWTDTLQIPIPKIRGPQTINDYRKITLCNIFYKIYTKHLGKVLDNVMGELPTYQAAFTKNRSTDDHIFTVRRILEEKWREGDRMYVMSLDLIKAFDSIDNAVVPIILKHNGVPGWLTNRITAACLREETAILWFGQKTERRKKSKGVKQGCPLSPQLFNIVLHEALKTLQEILPKFALGLGNNITPCILAFADDIIILAEEEEDLNNLLEELPEILEAVGLKINLQKSTIMIRDPIDPQEMNPSKTLMIGNHQLQHVRKTKYLGTYLTDTLDRPETVAQRIKKACQATRIIGPFIQKRNLSWNITKIVYTSVILPIAMYGLQATVTTKANRTRLKHMERKIVQILKEHSREETEEKTPRALNNKTVLKRLQIRRLRYWGHVVRRDRNHILQEAMRLRTRGTLKVGRPCYTWNDTLQEDIRKSGKSEEWWRQEATNKQILKTTTNALYKRKMNSDSEESEATEDLASADSEDNEDTTFRET